MATTTAITPQDYIAWVQRSLNRLIGSSLVTKGNDTAEYREKVREFKSTYRLSGPADIGPREQNALIKANHSTPEYVKWAQTALEKVGAGVGHAPTGIMDAATKTAIRSFQAYEDLLDDGWIGAKTETVLIKRSGIGPPGHVTPSTPPKPKPEEIQTSIVVSGRVPRMHQKGYTCWAAAFAMMYGWKHGRRTPIVEVLDTAGDDGWWTKRYNDGHFLSEGHTAKLAKILGLKGETKMPENWVAKLVDHGPLMVVQDPDISGWLHWIVVTGWRKTMVFSDRSLDREDLQYNEPFNGTSLYKNLGSLTEEAKSVHVTHYRWFHF